MKAHYYSCLVAPELDCHCCNRTKQGDRLQHIMWTQVAKKKKKNWLMPLCVPQIDSLTMSIFHYANTHYTTLCVRIDDICDAS